MVKFNKIAGVDEVGRGCLAGPVFSAAVILNNRINTKEIKDSKKLSFKKRILLSQYIKKNSIYAIGIAAVDERIFLTLASWPKANFETALRAIPSQKP